MNTLRDQSAEGERKLSLGFSQARVGGHSARSMMFLEMLALVRAMPLDSGKQDLVTAIVEENILDKPTHGSRVKSMRHLVELYGMDPAVALFRMLWALGHSDIASLSQLCLVCAYARDPQLRHSFELVRSLGAGAVLTRPAMEQKLEDGFPDRFSPIMKKSMAQNVNTSWTFGGHLTGRSTKIRVLPVARPVSAAYAMFIGYLSGLRGEFLLNSAYGALVASSIPELRAAIALASAKGLLSLKQAGGIVEFDFNNILSAKEQGILNDSD